MLFHAFLYFETRYISSYEKLVSLVRIKERNPVLQGSPKETKALTARRLQSKKMDCVKNESWFLGLKGMLINTTEKRALLRRGKTRLALLRFNPPNYAFKS